MGPFSVLKEKYDNIRFDLYPNEKTNTVFLSGFIVPVNLRNTGIGTSFMEDLVSIADENGYKIILTPSDSYGGSVRRLKEFYKRFGFIENKGKNRDFSHKEDMYRDPIVMNTINEEISRIQSIIKSIL
jgi:predicted N-acetyltransferase YhbS